ncbi:MAG: sulfotransferase [Pseudomonadota bacterium]
MTSHNWLATLNAALADSHPPVVTDMPAHPSVFIVGAPRSGTTILSQYLAASFDVGYVNNLMACFWNAPVYGALLARKLTPHRQVSTVSEFGATPHITDPHEFGAFWRTMLAYQGMQQRPDIEPDALQNLADTLDQVSRVFGQPVVYKVYQLAWHIQEFQRVRPASRWLWVKRDVEDNALSLLRFRRKMHGDDSQWVSSLPLAALSEEFPDRYHEVVFQVLAINEWLGRSLGAIDRSRWATVDFSTFVSQPGSCHEALEALCGAVDTDASRRFADGVVAPATRHSDADVAGVRSAIAHYASLPRWQDSLS